MIDTNNLADVRLHARYDDAGISTHIKVEWLGESLIVMATFEFFENADPAWVDAPPLAIIDTDDLIRVGPYQLRVIGIDQRAKGIFLRKIGLDPAVQIDEDGWIARE